MPERKKELPPEALRALKEAEQRRLEKKEVNFPKELGGREGEELSGLEIGRRKVSQLIFKSQPNLLPCCNLKPLKKTSGF